MGHYPDTENHIRDKGKVVLDFANYSAKKQLEHLIRIDAFNLAAEKKFGALNAKVHELCIKELVKVATGLNNLKPKIDRYR